MVVVVMSVCSGSGGRWWHGSVDGSSRDSDGGGMRMVSLLTLSDKHH